MDSHSEEVFSDLFLNAPAGGCALHRLYGDIRRRLAAVRGVSDGELAAEVFYVLADFGVTRTDVYADKVRQFSESERRRLLNICGRLYDGQPVQYALGYAWFLGRRYRVDASTLIPRPETGELADWAVAEARSVARDGQGLHILDAGTGSGCIAVSLALALPRAALTACDISAGALAVARGNAGELGAGVRFVQCDMLASLPAGPGGFDLIVSNPPYVCQRERADMERGVLDYEPHTALFVPDDDPLRFYRALARHAAAGALRSGGRLMVEINRAYGPDVAALFEREGLHRAEVRRDAFGCDRMVMAVR